MYDYKVLEGVDHPLFYFETTNEYEYTVSFVSNPIKQLDIPILEVSVDCMNHESPIKDLLVGKTIIEIIKKELEQDDTKIVTYVCDGDDLRQLARKRKFCGWYDLYNDTDYVLLNFETEEPQLNKTYYTSVLYNPKVYREDFIRKNHRNQVNSTPVK